MNILTDENVSVSLYLSVNDFERETVDQFLLIWDHISHFSNILKC